MGYIYRGARPDAVAMTTEQVRTEMQRLRNLQAQIQAENLAKEKELQRIRASRKRLEPVATYAPTPEALAYRELYAHTIAAQPTPLHGGIRGLRMATREAAEHDARKNRRRVA